MPPVAVVGGGLAGLTAARALRRRGVDVAVFEAGRQIAGLARSFRDAEGYSHDFGAHFITNRLAASLGVGARCRDVARYGETVRLGARSYGYPYGLLEVPRFVLSALRRPAQAAPPRTAAEWFRGAYGEALADEVALPLLEAWSGAPAAALSAAVGEKLPGSVARTLALKAAGLALGKAIAIGYCRELPERASVWHVYPEGGVGALCDRLAEGMDDVIELESKVEAIYVDDGRAVGVRVNGRDRDAAAVVSTAPVNILAKLAKGTDALAHLARFRYRPMVFANLRFRGRALLPDTVEWFPEKGHPYFRLTEATRSMPWLAPEGRTQITADIGCETTDPVWSLPEDAVGELCLAAMTSVIPDARARYLGCKVLRTPVAYPVFLEAYEADRRRLAASTGVAGLYSIGRNGEFDHILMEDVYCRTLARMRVLVRELAAERGPTWGAWLGASA